MQFRIGIGYDLHKLVPDRKLVLGGLDIPHTLGLHGHSDADVLIHSIMDAMLGALALGDIGFHFPPGAPEYKDIDSKILLNKVNRLILDNDYKVSNLDSIIIAEKPTLSPYIMPMRAIIAKLLLISPYQVSIKATTTEGCGIIGESKAIAAKAVVLLEKLDS